LSLTGELVAEIKHEQALYGKPRAIKKLLERAQKAEDNNEEVQRLEAQYQEAKTSKKELSEKGQLLKDLKKQQKQLSLTIKKRLAHVHIPNRTGFAGSNHSA